MNIPPPKDEQANIDKVRSWLATGPKKVGPFTVSMRLFIEAVEDGDIAVVDSILKAVGDVK